jgi:hypothetical protein
MNDESKKPSSGDVGSLELKLQSCDAELQKVRREAEEQANKALKNHEMLLMELQKAFHESEDYFVKWKQAEELGGNLSLNVESVTRGAFHEQGSHRHCNLTLGGVDLFDRRWDRMDLRLVEHHGNAGLMVFKSESGGSPFYSWKQDGERGGASISAHYSKQFRIEKVACSRTCQRPRTCTGVRCFFSFRSRD